MNYYDEKIYQLYRDFTVNQYRECQRASQRDGAIQDNPIYRKKSSIALPSLTFNQKLSDQSLSD